MEGCGTYIFWLFYINMANINLMIYLSCIQADDPNFIWSGAEGAYIIIKTWNRENEKFGNYIEFSSRDTHSPNERINILNMFLGRFCGYKKMLLPQSPPHFSIHTLMSKACNFSIIILYSYGPYYGFFQKNCF